VRCRVTVKGRLSDRLAGAFAGMTVEAAGETTTIVGTVADQAQLIGLIEQVAGLGLVLVSLATDETQTVSAHPG
jgi:hypothetical protein